MIRAATCLLLAALPATAAAQLSLTGRVGSTGAVLEAGLRIGDRLGVRAGTSFGSWSYRQRIANVSYEANLAFSGQTAIADLYLSRGGSFHLSGGVATPPVDFTATGNPSLNHYYVIGDHSYTEAQVGTLTAAATWSDALPYVGLGWSGGRHGERLAVVFDIGAIVGTPTMSLAASGGTPPAALAADLAAERDAMQRDVDRYLKVYPILSLGVRLRL
jgi:hypothetical protein